MKVFLYIIIFICIICRSGNTEEIKKESSGLFSSVIDLFDGIEYCSPLKHGDECKKKSKTYNFYTSLIGGPVILFNINTFKDPSLGGGSADVSFGVNANFYNKYNLAIEVKLYNQIYIFHSSQLGISKDFDLNSSLHGMQVQFIGGFMTGPHKRIKPYTFLGFNVGGSRMTGHYQGKTMNLAAPTIGGAIAVGSDFEILPWFDIGIEFPFGMTVMMIQENGGVTPRFFPDFYPNISFKISY